MDQQLDIEAQYRNQAVAGLYALAKKYKAQDKDMSVAIKKPLIADQTDKKVMKHLRNQAVVVEQQVFFMRKEIQP